MSRRSTSRRWRTAIVLLAVGVLVLTSAAGSVQASLSDDATPFGATTDTACTQSDAASTGISHVQIKATDETITTDTPAEISGQATAPRSNPCPLVVQMVLTIPSGMYVSGTDNVNSGGQGQLTSSFRVSPGEAVTMSANVFSRDLGSEVLIVDFEYFPVGYPEESNRLSGFSIEIDTETPNPGPLGETPTSEPDDNRTLLYSLGGLVVGALLVLVFR